ncbi:MAG TPA: hypothetical protein PLD20_33865 [Blastocatellia bacterium]|nr:hypothetical protein [Blastocatellia bacterium]HMX27802.1 hypothetical protein [Blastocatellia bacterium]HMZ22960.1 hypothetical protein [Blastocatellia bacterium]HNG30094.1 hypothetical protein [Blastocatellia bacterium]
MTEEDKINEALAHHLNSSLSAEAKARIRELYGAEIAQKVNAVYRAALDCPVDWRTATMDSALSALRDFLAREYPWLSPEAKSSLNYCFIMAWK